MRSQVVDAIADGEKLLSEPLQQGRWDGWEIHAEDLLARALGHGHWPKEFRETTGGGSSFAVVRDVDVYGYPDEGDAVETRNEVVGAKIGVLRGALKAIDQELERRGAQPPSPTLRVRDFAFMHSDRLKAMATRDYDELRLVAGTTIKAAALLAGSVVEAVLHDALEHSGIATKELDDMRFHDLIIEAAAAKLITERTKKAADVARDIRNLVHPVVELREGRLRKVDAEHAVSVMQLVLEELE